MKLRYLLPAAAIVLIAGGATRAAAAPVVFDFEGVTATSSIFTHPGSYTLLEMTQDGLTVSITRPGSAFDVVDHSSFPAGSFPASWGNRSLDPFSAERSSTPFVINFSSSVSSFAIDFGDFGADSDTVTLNLYSGLNGGGTLLGTTSVVYGTTGFPNFMSIGLAALGINSVTLIGGSEVFVHSLYYDNLRVTRESVVPEPAVFLLMTLGAAAGVRRWRTARQ